MAKAYSDLHRTPEAVALYQLAQTYAVRTKQLIQSGQFDESAVIKITDADVSAFENQLRVGSLKARASWYLANGQREQDLSEQMEDLKLDSKEVVSLYTVPQRSAGIDFFFLMRLGAIDQASGYLSCKLNEGWLEGAKLDRLPSNFRTCSVQAVLL